MKPLAVALAFFAAVSPLSAQERVGFHVRAWVQWDDQRIELGDGYVGGPHGIGIAVLARLETAVFAVRVKPADAGDSTRYYATIEVRVGVSDTLAETPLYAIDSYGRGVSVKRGDAAELTLPFHPQRGETATLKLRIDGPTEPRPAATGRWMERVVREPRGVYYRTASYRPGLTVTPFTCAGALAVRMSAGASLSGVDVLACGDESTPVAIPGLSGRWLVMIQARPNAEPDDQCLVVSEAAPGGHVGQYQPRSWATWCVQQQDRWSPVGLRLSTGETIRAQLIP